MIYKLNEVAFKNIDKKLYILINDNLKLENDEDKGSWLNIEELYDIDNDDGKKLCNIIGSLFPYMPSSINSSIVLPTLFLKQEIKSDHIVLYPGSFNPWHKGHRACLDVSPCSHILVVMDNNPLKNCSNFKCNWREYLKLCHKLKDTNHSIYPGFLNRKKNYTVDWLEDIKARTKDLILGYDSFATLLDWKEPLKLLGFLSKIYVVPRQYDIDEVKKTEREIKKLKTNVEIIFLENHDYQDYSSTTFRSDKH